MLPRTYDAQNCSLARSLEVVGERWTLLILRDAFLGIRRFDEFQSRLAVSRTVLAGRLSQLVDEGLFQRKLYHEHPERYEYTLTQKGLDLWPALNALRAWGDAYATPNGVPREFVHDACGTGIHAAAFCPHCQAIVPPDEVLTEPGPGYRGSAEPRQTRLLATAPRVPAGG
jgi:DNA-binding HxlR family transcriptional regulator